MQRGGDCEAIEQYVFALFAECVGKITHFIPNSGDYCQKY